MDSHFDIPKIKRLEFLSGFLATMAPVFGVLVGGENKMAILLLIGGAGVAMQPYIYFLYAKLDKTDEYKRKKFWPLTLALLFILFLALNNTYNWLY